MPHAQSAGRVTDVLLKPQKHTPMVRPDAGLRLIKGVGIKHDCQRNPLGPRQVLLVEAATLRDFDLRAEDLRANLVVDDVELNSQASGTVIRLGRARVRLTHRCEVCRILHPLLPKQELARLMGRRGYLGVVTGGGRVRVGDSAALLDAAYPAVPDGLFDRFAWVVSQIPRGRVMSFAQILLAVGGSRSYSRVLPAFVRRAARSHPSHRVLDSSGALVRGYESQARRLRREGVAIVDDRVELTRYGWPGAELYTALA